ncbi:MAG: hypothetical protein Q9O62_11680 [Ardenticatenia bacterium]|nr:hypothetical protein [Ardenticatenia bacterium]
MHAEADSSSPIYLDLRMLASYPAVLSRVASLYVNLLRPLRFDRLAAIPYAGLPIGTAVTLLTGTPLIYRARRQKPTAAAVPLKDTLCRENVWRCWRTL